MAKQAALYLRFRAKARRIAAGLPVPDFYRAESRAVARSRGVFDADPLVGALRAEVASRLEDDFGHGIKHATLVALDAGALMAIQARAAGYRAAPLRRLICVVQCAGLLHDIERKQRNHSELGAESARRLLAGYPFSAAETEDICIGIRNHEAFKSPASVDTLQGAMVSDCLYDADKFRWGPDNFTDTLWAMLSFHNTSPSDFLRHYPRGMESLERIKATFRTRAGRTYGPQFIDLGIAIGEELYRAILAECSRSGFDFGQ
jgi:hypothetical protein